MIFVKLKEKLRELTNSKATLLWLEGATHERVLKLKLCGNKIVLNLANNTIRIFSFDRYVCTSVGLQFWYQGKPSVLYRWDQVSKAGTKIESENFPDDDPNPPNLAA